MKRKQKETAEQYLERIPSFAKKKSGMEDVRAFLELLGSPDRGMKIFHVAGTNGKGSVCAFLSSALKEAGLCCGAFTSPHLSDIRERFLIQGEMVSREAFDQAFETVYGAAGQWTAQGKPHPTYFEFLFYMGMVLFSRAGTEVLVLETGMGGLYDVTNVVERPLVSVITSVSIDHTAFLGHTAGEIAVHKAGIIKPGCPAVYDDSCPEAEVVILETAEKKGSPAFPVGCVPFRLEGETLVFQWDYLGKTEEFTVGFPAPYQAENAALAVTALSVSGLGIPAEAVRRGLRSARWPARMERLLPGVYLDGAHNEDGIRAFLEAACLLKRERRPETTRLLFAVAADKEYGRMLEEIGRSLQPDECYLTAADTSRALSVDGLFQAARERMPETARIRCFETTKKAFEALLADRTGRDLSFIAGSLYLAGEIRTAAAAWMEEER